MHKALTYIFEQELEFRQSDGSPIDGGVYIGATEILPIPTLQREEGAYQEELEKWYYDAWMPVLGEQKTHILGLFGNAGRYADLCDSIRRGQVVPFIGSGMSVPSGCPTWGELLWKIHEYTTIEHDQLESLILASRFEEAADLLASGTNRNLLNERIEHDLRIDNLDQIDGPIQILPAIFPNLVITTNLDDVLEGLYKRSEAAFTNILAGTDVGRFRNLRGGSASTILKLHGDCRHPATRVLLSTEYDAAYAAGSVPREELALIYRTYNLLFLGCSLGPDRTIQLIDETALSDPNMPKHYAFLKDPGSREQWVQQENFLTARGIYPIWYDADHDESLMALLAGLLDCVGE